MLTDGPRQLDTPGAEYSPLAGFNDDFNDTIFTEFPIRTIGSNFTANTETGEQQLDFTGGTTWLFFNAPFTGTVDINTMGSDYDTQLHIYEGFFDGATVADLIPVVNNDDTGESGETGQSRVEFDVVAGVCYEIRIGGFQQIQGNIVLNGDYVSIVGDVNCDGVVDLLDVSPFVDLIINGGFTDKADINMDGTVDLLPNRGGLLRFSRSADSLH